MMWVSLKLSMEIHARFHLRHEKLVFSDLILIWGAPRLLSMILTLRRRLRVISRQMIVSLVIMGVTQLVQIRTVALKWIIHIFYIDFKLVKLHVKIILLFVRLNVEIWFCLSTNFGHQMIIILIFVFYEYLLVVHVRSQRLMLLIFLIMKVYWPWNIMYFTHFLPIISKKSHIWMCVGEVVYYDIGVTTIGSMTVMLMFLRLEPNLGSYKFCLLWSVEITDFPLACILFQGDLARFILRG